MPKPGPGGCWAAQDCARTSPHYFQRVCFSSTAASGEANGPCFFAAKWGSPANCGRTAARRTHPRRQVNYICPSGRKFVPIAKGKHGNGQSKHMTPEQALVPWWFLLTAGAEASPQTCSTRETQNRIRSASINTGRRPLPNLWSKEPRLAVKQRRYGVARPARRTQTGDATEGNQPSSQGFLFASP